MLVQHSQNKESGVVGLILLGVVVVGIAAAAFMFVARAQKDKPADATNTASTSSESESQEPDESAAIVNARNTQRKTDAAVLLSYAEEYMNNNSGKAPTTIDSTMLQGFTRYSGAEIITGVQVPVTSELLRLVTRAHCIEGGSTAEGTSRQIAVQYSLEQTDGSFKPACVNN